MKPMVSAAGAILLAAVLIGLSGCGQSDDVALGKEVF